MRSSGMKPIRIQINDGDERHRRILVRHLTERGYQCLEAADGREGIRTFVHQCPDVVITDIPMTPVDGLEFLRRAQSTGRDTPILVLTTETSEDVVLSALRLGARDFIRKSVGPASVELSVKAALTNDDRGPQEVDPDSTIIGESPGVVALRRNIQKMARADQATVLVLGESGSGKELVAHQLHLLSGRPGPFVPLNCALSQGGLIENALFGHERGAFTDAKTREKGLLEHAHGGTLFLDEIGEMDVEIQPKFLRFLETGSFRRIGGTEEVVVDTRVVAATHRDLKDMVKEKRFRKDLFFRLNVLPLEVPPLRNRGGDLFMLAEHFIHRAATRLNMPLPPISDKAREVLACHDWPGNVRELKNMMERFVLLQEGLTVDLEDLPLDLLEMTTSAPEPPEEVADQYLSMPYADARRDFECNYFRKLLELHQGNIASVSPRLGSRPIEREAHPSPS